MKLYSNIDKSEYQYYIDLYYLTNAKFVILKIIYKDEEDRVIAA